MKNKFVIGADIGGTNTAVGMISESGTVLKELNFMTRDFPDASSFAIGICAEIKAHLQDISDNYELCGVGLGAPNGNYYSGMVENAPNLNWKGKVRLSEMFSNALGVKTVITNDANAAALGEMIYGGAKGQRNFVVITIGTGLGSGIVVNGELLYGKTGFAGEIGHTVFQQDGRLCTCGKRGCLEAYVSSRGLQQTALEMLEKDSSPSLLRELPSNKMSPRNIAKAANSGDAIANAVFEESGRILGTQLADTVAYLSPETIFLYGGIAGAGDLILKPAQKALEENMLKIFLGSTKIELSRLQGKSGGILGAAALAWKSFCTDEKSLTSVG